MTDFETFKKEILKDEDVRREYGKLAPRYAIISDLIAARIKHKMTQAEVAKKVGTKQSAIARLESGNVNPSLDLLQKVAQVMGYKLTIHFSK